jgi:predicted nucleotidyltransferase component of viral defense system
MWSERQTIEIFHLLFLRAFGARVGKDLYALKGGCNLRFFNKSIRYSEDMDLDVRTISVPTLRNNVDRVLEMSSFRQTLRAQEIQLADISLPKQTETTQRWKLRLRIGTAGLDVPTKIEFSRRSIDHQDVVYEPVDSGLISRYRLYPVLVQHYAAAAAVAQKIAALALRSQTQARDVFDLALLLDAGVSIKRASADVRSNVPRAIENAIDVGYDAFAGQVLAYLEPEYQEGYRARRVWEDLQQRVVTSLRTLQS